MIRRPPRSTLFPSPPLSRSLVVLDPATGTLRYATCGHPPPLIVGLGGKARYLEGTGTGPLGTGSPPDRKSTRLNSSHSQISYAVFCLQKKKNVEQAGTVHRR